MHSPGLYRGLGLGPRWISRSWSACAPPLPTSPARIESIRRAVCPDVVGTCPTASEGFSTSCHSTYSRRLDYHNHNHYNHHLDGNNPWHSHLDGQSFDIQNSAVLPSNSPTAPDDSRAPSIAHGFRRSRIPSHNDGLIAGFWKLFNSSCNNPNLLFEAYSKLPTPRLRYLSQEQIYELLSKLSSIRKRDESAMLRYLTVIDDMKTGRVPIPRVHWNVAISFVAKCYHKLTDHDLQSGLFLWKEMEKTAGISADATTFNILFHLAANSNMAHLPLMILKEMKRRKVLLDRFSYVNLIIYYGKQGNGAGIRSTYRELVEAGEIVDIVALNAIMTALIEAGEPQAAEDILMHLTQTPGRAKQISPRTKRTKRIHKDMRELKCILRKQGFNTSVDLRQPSPAPDLISFAIFIDYHASETADFAKIIAILNDLSQCGINSDTAIFQSLFKGFTLHGRVKYSPWTLPKLNAAFDAFIEGSYAINRDAALWCLRAYVVLAGKGKGRAIWQMVKDQWAKQGGDAVQ